MSDLRTPLDAVAAFYLGIHRAMDRLMKARGASFARTKLLLFVQRHGPVRSADIAEAFGHAPRTVTEAIDGLERQGLLRRDPDPQDRRAKRISITPAGVAAVEASEPAREAFLSDVFAVLDDAERKTLSTLFGKLNVQLSVLEKAEDSSKP